MEENLEETQAEALHQTVSDRASLIQRASRFGIHVSDSMDTERLVSMLESLDQQLAGQPVRVMNAWKPGSPRG